MSSFFHVDVIKIITKSTDVGTSINFLRSCKTYSKLLYDIEFWSSKIDNKKDIFEEFAKIGNTIRKDGKRSLIEELSYSKSLNVLMDELSYNKNLDVLNWFDDLYGTFSDGNIIKIITLLVTSIVSLYKLFYEIGRWNGKCKFISSNNYVCLRLSLPFDSYCRSCRHSYHSCKRLYTIFHEYMYGYKIIALGHNGLARDVENNYVFSVEQIYDTKYYKLIGKLDERKIIPVTEEDKRIAKGRYISNSFVNF
jgi:hypothetical protein